MRELIVSIVFVGSWFSALCQNQSPIFLNEDDLKTTFLNEKNITSMDVDKKRRGIFISPKKPFVFLSLDTIYKRFSQLPTIAKSGDNVIYTVDGKLITEKDKVKIDASFYVYLKEKNLSKVNYINNKFRDLVIVEITLSATEIKPKIILRGGIDSLTSKNE
ncbi:MAG TPA: hypothetical protein DGG95_01555 [Cytophagales bacterium]|jgi:hypothetical protein|nr:hypothetical protein [Cytophagales bacterium]